MKIKNRKLLTLIMIVVLVLSQSIISFAEMSEYFDKSLCPQSQYGKANTYNIVLYTASSTTERFEYITIESDSRVCILRTGKHSSYNYLDYAELYCEGSVVSSSKDTRVAISEYEVEYEEGKISDSDSGSANWYWKCWQWFNINCLPNEDGYLEYAMIYTDIPVFDDETLAQNYCDTGDMSGATVQPSKQYNADEIYLDNFYFEVHDSNELSEFYITFYYTPSDYLVQNGGKVYCDYYLGIDYSFLSGAIDMTDFINPYGSIELPCHQGENVYQWNIDVWNFVSDTAPTWFAEFVEGAILGDEAFIDFEGVSIGDVGGNTVAQIEKSTCDVTVYPVLDNQLGMTYTGTIDFLNPQNSYYSSNTPDSSGNYVSDGNYTQQDGYYYTEVSQDNYGNNTYNYYYITDNSRTEIDSGSDGGGSGTGIQQHHHEHKWEGSVNVNVNGSFGGGSSSGDNVTIEDDDLTSDGLRSAIEDGYGLFDLVSTEKDNDGFLSLLTTFMGSLDDDMSNLIGFGMGTTVALALLLRLLNR